LTFPAAFVGRPGASVDRVGRVRAAPSDGRPRRV